MIARMKPLSAFLYLCISILLNSRRARAFVAPQPSTVTKSSSLCLSIQHQSSTVSSALVRAQIDRSEAKRLVDELLCPKSEERDRNSAGMQAFDTGTTEEYRGHVIENNDPRTQYTYGEFPFDSFDLLIDRALEYIKQNKAESIVEHKKNTMVDLGSGCGRLVFYAALTRGNEKGDSAPWDFHGIEIGSQLHSLAVSSLQRGVDNALFSLDSNEEVGATGLYLASKIELHNGNALLVEDPYFPKQLSTVDGSSNESDMSHESIQSLLSQTTILFAYSTVWETDSIQPFNPEVQAMVLSSKWSQTLASLCPNGCLAITTDRALNPRDGWRLLESMEVENPSVWGSVGYISILEK